MDMLPLVRIGFGALVALGYPATDADKAVFAALEDGGAGDTADLIRKALARVAKRG